MSATRSIGGQLVGLTLACLWAAIGARGQAAADLSLGSSSAGWRFIENFGQWDDAALFVATRGGGTIRLECDAAVLRLARRKVDHDVEGVVLRLSWPSSAAPSAIDGSNAVTGKSHFVLGNDASQWHTNVPAFGTVTYHGLRDGVDLVWHDQAGQLEFDLVVSPRGDVGAVEFLWEGVTGIEVRGDGSLVLRTPFGDARQTSPIAWEEDESGIRTPVECRYHLLGGDRFGFQVTRRNAEARLVIDPGLEWSTLLGGGHQDEVIGVAVAVDGTVTVGSQTLSVDFPTTPGAFDSSHTPGSGNWDVCVSRLDANGSGLQFSTYLGGSDPEFVVDIAVASNGETVVAGTAYGTSFPTTPGAFDTTYSPFGLSEAFATRIRADGSGLVYSTLLGEESIETCRAMALSLDGVVTLAGQTNSPDFPVTPGAFDVLNEGAPLQGDAYVAKLSPAGDALLYATFLGGSTTTEEATAMGGMADGSVIVAGRSNLSGIPWTHNYGSGGLYVVHFDSTLSQLLYATSLGGSGDDRVHDVAIDFTGAAYLTGWTMASDFPVTPGAFDSAFSGNLDAYVLKLATSGSLVYSTLLGGGGADLGTAIVVDSGGVATAAGTTQSTTFPTTPGAAFPVINGSAFVTRVNPQGTALWYSTSLGSSLHEGSPIDERSGLDLGSAGEVVVGGYTTATTFPTTPGAFDPSANGMKDGFIAKLDMLPTGVSKYGSSTAGCQGKSWTGVTAMPKVGGLFGITCTNADPLATPAFLMIGIAGVRTGLSAKGTQMWVSPFLPYLLVPVGFNDVGFTNVSLAIPSVPSFANLTLFVQVFNASSCAPNGWAASNALAVTIQP